MKRSEFTKALAKGINAESKMKSACDDMIGFFKPYFDCEIDVLHQMGDGFVIHYNMDTNDNYSNLNEPVDDAFNKIPN